MYLRPSFTLPASGLKTSDKNWDRAFLSRDKFFEKYGEEPTV